MKNSILSLLFATIVSSTLSAQKNEIKAVIERFANAGDQQDANALSDCLDDNYRVVMNQLFGSPGVTVLPKEAFVEKIRSKEFGGDKRSVKVTKIVVSGKTASAKVSFVGEKMSSVSLVTLVQSADGKWKLVNETPIIL